MQRLLLLLGLLFSVSFLAAQDARLAQQYFRDGEFEKAAVLYEKLYKASRKNELYFDRYVECQLAMEAFDVAKTVLDKEIKRYPERSNLYVAYGKMYERQFMDKEAEVYYKQAIERLPPEQFAIVKLGNAFVRQTKYDLAVATYEKGAELLKDDQIFAQNLGDLYLRKGDVPRMIEQYLNNVTAMPQRLNYAKSVFQRNLGEPGFEELQAQLYERIQSDESNDLYPELLSWVFIQRKDYNAALRQARALDRRYAENGGRVYRLGTIAFNAKDYDTAIKAFEYITEDKGVASTYYIDSKREALRARRLKLVEGYDYTMEELKELEGRYEIFLEEFGRTAATGAIMLELGELEAFYLNDLDKAISILGELVAFPNINKELRAEAKLRLADFYLIKGDRWESTLLYSQVDKDFKEGNLGNEARFRNAKLSYYMGDFEWAQAQFDILKASTSKVIANDALDLSVFIMDNLGLDSTATAVSMYAQADLLTFQNRFDEAFQVLDRLMGDFPDHSLQDDVLYQKAQIYKKQREYVPAAAALDKIIENYGEEIKADNAIFELAELYETHLDDLEKAKSLYEKLFLDYSNSTFAVTARKRFRALRGDEVN